MAKKGQRFKSYPPELKTEIIEKYNSGQSSARSLGMEYGISPKTIENWIAKQKHGIDITTDHRRAFSGRTKEEKIDYKERYEILKKYQAFIEARREKK